MLVAQLCSPLCSFMDYSPPDSSVHGLLQARILERVAIPFSRGSSQPRDGIRVFCTAGRMGSLGGSDSKESTCFARKLGFYPWVGKIPWRREWLPSPVFLLGKPHGQRNLVGYSPCSCKDLDTAEVTEHARSFTNLFFQSVSVFL